MTKLFVIGCITAVLLATGCSKANNNNKGDCASGYTCFECTNCQGQYGHLINGEYCADGFDNCEDWEAAKVNNVGRIARINADGTLDNSFNASGSGFDNNDLHSLAIQTDGKIIVGGTSTQFNGSSVPRLVRLHTDGTLDNTFNPGGAGPDELIWSVAVEDDGKIMIGGEFSSYNTTTSRRMARLNGNATTTSVEGVSDYLSLTIFPNPANEFVNINHIPQNAMLRIFDLTGKVMFEQFVSDNVETVNISGFPAGIYLVQTHSEGTLSNKQFIVTR